MISSRYVFRNTAGVRLGTPVLLSKGHGLSLALPIVVLLPGICHISPGSCYCFFGEIAFSGNDVKGSFVNL